MKNVLSQEKSPYLLQHKDNPVAWQAWGDAAFALAREQDKPVFLSIGYSTCYWCHVMEKDSFEHNDVAEILNQHFIPIKVDREELPDVDAIYMDAVVGIHGHGGWPMSVFLTPEGRPFWGGTFFYREQFKGILLGVANAWRSDRERVTHSSEELTQYLARKQAAGRTAPLPSGLLQKAAEELYSRYDPRWGGFGSAPKFPPAQALQLLLRFFAQTGDAAALEAFTGTARGMALGGIFDHVGGGFHRYSVDERWLIPHFEKMLYDNALLVPAYLEGYQVTQNKLWRDVAERTLQYLLREMGSPEGAFFTAQDAGEVGKEGEFYAWTPAQVHAVCGDGDGATLCELYGVTAEGNFEGGTSVLHLASEDAWNTANGAAITHARERLLEARNNREWPHRDEKILTGWNGLLITAFCRGYEVLGDDRYLAAAQAAATFIVQTMAAGVTLQRRYFKGAAGIDAMLEDYAYVIQGFLALFEASGSEEWLAHAARLQDEQHQRLWSEQHSAYLSSAHQGLIVPLVEWSDGATPSPNGISLSNLLWLAQLTGEGRFAERLEQLVHGVPAMAARIPSGHCSTVMALWTKEQGVSTLSILPAVHNEHSRTCSRAAWSHFLPLTAVLSGGAATKGGFTPDSNGKQLFSVCRGRVCLEPTVDVEAALRLCSVPKL